MESITFEEHPHIGWCIMRGGQVVNSGYLSESDAREGWTRIVGERDPNMDPSRSAVWGWFELTYSAYMVLPRALMCEMPGEWQEQFVQLIGELEARFTMPITEYMVKGRENGRFVHDPLSQYRHPSRSLIERLDKLSSSPPVNRESPPSS